MPELEMTNCFVLESPSCSKAMERSKLAGALQSSVDPEPVSDCPGHSYHCVSYRALETGKGPSGHTLVCYHLSRLSRFYYGRHRHRWVLKECFPESGYRLRFDQAVE